MHDFHKNNDTFSDAVFVFLHLLKANRKQADIKPPLMSVLRLLQRTENHENKYLTPTDICDFFGYSRQSLTPMLNTLEEMGLVERKLNRQDRRSWEILLTDKGKMILGKNKENFQIAIDKIKSVFSHEEIELFSELLNKASEAVKQHSEAK